MLFVSEINTLIKYLQNRSLFHKSDEDRLRQNIFESINNSIVYNKNFVDALEDVIDENHPLKDDCTNYIRRLIDFEELGVNVGVEEELDDPDIIFEKLCKYSQKNDILIGVSEDKETLDDFVNILNISNILLNNKNHIFSKLLSNEVCQIRNSDLNDNHEILTLLKATYNLYNNIDKVIIIDRQTNVNHNLFNTLIDKSPSFHYYKLYAKPEDSLAIRRKFKKSTLYTTSNEDLIHERIVLFGSLIITLDDDPYNVEHRKTWNITITNCKRTTDNIIQEKCNKFIKTLF